MSRGSALENVLRVLNSRGARVRRAGGGYITQCPAHEDNDPSMSLGQGEKGVVFNCHAGCEQDDIRVALDIPWSQLFDGDGDRPVRSSIDNWMPCQGLKDTPPEERCSGTKIAEYKYVDEKGKLLFSVCRCSRKNEGCKRPFGQWQPDPSKLHGKRWSLQGVRRVVYRLPEVLRAIEEGRRVWFTEGEKDADLLASMGEVATTSPMGADSWIKEYARYFREAEVIIVADCDRPGLKHAGIVFADMGKFAKTVKVVCTPIKGKGADASDHFSYGLGFDDFEDVPVVMVEPRPLMEIRIEAEHKKKEVIFAGFSQESVERSLVGSMLRFGQSYAMAAVDIVSDKKLALVASAVARLAARGNLVIPETVAIELEDTGSGKYETALAFLEKLERVAFSDAEKSQRAARVLRERSMRREIIYLHRAGEAAMQNERRTIQESLDLLRRMSDFQIEEFSKLDRYCQPVGDVFLNGVGDDVVSEVQKEVAAQVSNVHKLRPVVTSGDIEEAFDGIAEDGAEDLPGDQLVHGRQNA